MVCGAVIRYSRNLLQKSKLIFIVTALVVTESGKVLIDVLPLAVFLVCLLFEVGKKVAFHLITVKEVVPLIDNGLIASATQCFGFDLRSKSLTLGNAQTSLTLLSLNRNFLCHALVVVFLALVLGFGKDVDAK